MIPGPPPGTYAEDDAAGSEQPSSGALGWPAPALPVAATGLAYGDFVKAVKDALRDVHSPDLLTRNPLLRDGLCNLGGSAGPQELKALLCETVGTLFISTSALSGASANACFAAVPAAWICASRSSDAYDMLTSHMWALAKPISASTLSSSSRNAVSKKRRARPADSSDKFRFQAAQPRRV